MRNRGGHHARRRVKHAEGEFTIADGEPGEITMALRDTLTGIQRGTFADTHGWMARLSQKRPGTPPQWGPRFVSCARRELRAAVVLGAVGGDGRAHEERGVLFSTRSVVVGDGVDGVVQRDWPLSNMEQTSRGGRADRVLGSRAAGDALVGEHADEHVVGGGGSCGADAVRSAAMPRVDVTAAAPMNAVRWRKVGIAVPLGCRSPCGLGKRLRCRP